MSRMCFHDALQVVLGQYGTDVLRNERVFVSTMLVICDAESPESFMLRVHCDDAFLTPYADATLTRDAASLEIAAQAGERYLRQSRYVDATVARRFSWDIASGIATFLGIAWGQERAQGEDARDFRTHGTETPFIPTCHLRHAGAALYIDDDDVVWASGWNVSEGRIVPPRFLGRFALRHIDGEAAHRLVDLLLLLTGASCETIVVTSPVAYDERLRLVQTLADAGVRVERCMTATSAVALAYAASTEEVLDQKCAIAHVGSLSVEVAVFDFADGVVEMFGGDMRRVHPRELLDEDLAMMVREALRASDICFDDVKQSIVAAHPWDDGGAERVAGAIESICDVASSSVAGIEPILYGALDFLSILYDDIEGVLLLNASWLDVGVLVGERWLIQVERFTTIPTSKTEMIEFMPEDSGSGWQCVNSEDEAGSPCELPGGMDRPGMLLATSLPGCDLAHASTREIPLGWLLEGRTSARVELTIDIDAVGRMIITVGDKDSGVNRRYRLEELLS